MADPTKLIFIGAFIDENAPPGEWDTVPPSYPNTGIVGRNWYISSNACLDDPTRRIYKPGQKRTQYPGYFEHWLGWPSMEYHLPIVEASEFALMIAQFNYAKVIDGWCWFSLWNAQTQQWKMKLGIMERPIIGGYTGNLYQDVTLIFGGIRPPVYSI